jgi:chemotaxis protein MotB
MRRRIKQEESILSISPMDNWRITFSDMITLLMTVFVMIVAMGTLNEKTVKKRLGLIKGEEAFIVMPETVPQEGKEALLSEQSAFSSDLMNRIRSSFPEDEKKFFISESDRGTVTTIPASLIFNDSGEKLDANQSKYLDAIASSLKKTRGFISIEGHSARSRDDEADSRLSLDIAAETLDYFIYQSGMSPTRFSIAGYGSKRPLAGKSPKTLLADDYRLDIVILAVKPFTETAGASSTK